MEELKKLNIELFSLKNDTVLILIEYLNEKNENCMRFDKIRVERSDAFYFLDRICTNFEKEYKNLDISIII